MSMRIDGLLSAWHPRKDDIEWVLATITHTYLSTYRKAGSMMLLNSLGEFFGMLSGGCLEHDLLLQARKVLTTQKSAHINYELREESDSGWQKGLGCGGSVRILLQAIKSENRYLGLDEVHRHLLQQKKHIYRQRIDPSGVEASQWEICNWDTETERSFKPTGTRLAAVTPEGEWLSTIMSPAPHLLIFGGGQDAQPLSKLADIIGWQVTVVDARQGYARNEDFSDAQIHRYLPSEYATAECMPIADAIVIMSHNISNDAQALRFAHSSSAKYIGVLGPAHRREKVEQAAGLRPADFEQHYRGPVGFDIGARFPETIALSILSECHLAVEGQNTTQKLTADSRE